MLASTIIWILLLIGTVRCWDRCDIEPVPGCECWNSERPEVTCSNLELDTVPELGDSALYSLDLSYNNLTTVTSLNGHSLRYLHLQHNQIQALHSPENDIEIVYTPDFEIEYLPSKEKKSGQVKFLEGSKDTLEWLDISHNRLRWLFKSDLEHFTRLRVLKLNHNQLEGFVKTSDTDFQSLRVLHLHNNPLWGFVSLPNNLDELSMTTYFGADDLPDIVHVKKDFTMTDTNLLFDWEMLFVKLKPNKNLQTLRLVNCSISLLMSDIQIENFQPIFNTKFSKSLIHLDLSHNDFIEIPSFKFNFRPASFKTLDLSYNGITSIGRTDIRQFKEIETIILHHNYINSVEGLSFRNLNHIKLLDIRDNLISKGLRKAAIPQKAYDKPGSVEVLLGSNWFDCNCKLKWLWDEAKNQTSGHLGFLSHYEISHTLICYTERTFTKDTYVRLIDYDMVGQGC